MVNFFIQDRLEILAMATNNPIKQTTFGLLPEPEGRMGSFGMSMVLNVSVAAVLLLLTIAQVHQVQQHKYTTELIFPVSQPKPYVPPAPKIKFLPPPPVVKEEAPKIEMPKPLQEPPKVVEMKTPQPVMPKIEAAPPLRVTPPPQPKTGLFKSEIPTPVANNHAAPTPKTGGFGDPVGVKPNPNANRAATIASVGSLDAAPGTASGSGAARKGTVQGVSFGSGVANGVPGGRDRGTVASAGFSSGVVGGTGQPGSHGTVARSNFGDMYGSAPTPTARPQEAVATPIVVLAKPLPTYTPEARQLKIEGDVTLQVKFEASGQVEVLRVVNGLGHGLDEQARIAAEHIRFKPATRDGHPIDEVSIIHVSFQMA